MSFVNMGTDKSTVEYLQKSMRNDSFEKRNITIAGDSETLDKLERMLAYMVWLGSVGHSTSFKVYVDGDGAFSTKITRDSKELTKIHSKAMEERVDENGDIESFDFS